MTVQELISDLELLSQDAEVSIDLGDVIQQISRVEDDSQGVYIVVDEFTSDRENW